jgi:prevent-host-death family protein
MKHGSYVLEVAVASVCFDIKKVTVTDFRDRLKDYLKAARADRVVLVENRRQPAKYVVDKEFLDALVRERESIMATLEILADRDLTDRLLRLSKTIDDDVVAGRLLRTADVFGA